MITACEGKECVFDVEEHIGLVALSASRALANDSKLFVFGAMALKTQHVFIV